MLRRGGTHGTCAPVCLVSVPVSVWPPVQFQKAKLMFEDELIRSGKPGDIDYSIVRPTAFFKSVSGQLEVRPKHTHT